MTLERSLSSLGLTTADITDVMLTHLHFDHAGGSTRVDGGQLWGVFAIFHPPIMPVARAASAPGNSRKRSSIVIFR